MSWVRVCRVEELGERAARRVEHDGQAVCVSLADGQPHAIDDRCPHRGIALSGGLVRDGVITCPGHFRRFDLRTGRCIGQPGVAVRSYPCAVVDGWVKVDLGTAPPRLSMRDILLAHARGGQHRPSDVVSGPGETPASVAVSRSP
jgi:nitrite reductase/ring-hydroxylating ferredoxin subunit